MNKLGTKLGAIAMSAVMALTFAPSAAITSLAAGEDGSGASKVGVENVYVVYNPNSGEHVFTADHDEVIDLLDAGWGEGDVAWVAPTVAGDPVYRIYNPNVFDPAGNPLGDHHYTTDKAEADRAVAAGWKYDNGGKPIFYSADPEDESSTAVYCAYNPNAYTAPKYSGAHQLTIDEDEYEGLVALGWKGEGEKFYGYEEGYEPGPVVGELSVKIDNTTPKVGDTLIATVTPDDAVVTYEWYADKTKLDETDDTLEITSDMVGKKISVKVTDLAGQVKTSEATAAVVKSLPELKNVLQESANQILLYFDSDASSIGADDILVERDEDSLVNSVEKVELVDPTTIKATLSSFLVDGKEYNVEVGGGNTSFTASVGEVASIRILTTTAVVNKPTKIEYQLLDEKGMDVTSTQKLKETVLVDITGTYKAARTSDPTDISVTMGAVKDKCEVTITYNKGTGSDESVEPATQEITCVEPSAANATIKYLRTDDVNEKSNCARFYHDGIGTPSTVSLAVNTDTEGNNDNDFAKKPLFFAAFDDNGAAIEYDQYEVESANEAYVAAKVRNNFDTGKFTVIDLVGNSAGATQLKVIATSNGVSKEYFIPITVKPIEDMVKVVLSSSRNRTLSNAYDEDYYDTITAAIIDDNNDKDAHKETIKWELKDKDNYKVDSNAPEEFQGKFDWVDPAGYNGAEKACVKAWGAAERTGTKGGYTVTATADIADTKKSQSITISVKALPAKTWNGRFDGPNLTYKIDKSATMANINATNEIKLYAEVGGGLFAGYVRQQNAMPAGANGLGSSHINSTWTADRAIYVTKNGDKTTKAQVATDDAISATAGFNDVNNRAAANVIKTVEIWDDDPENGGQLIDKKSLEQVPYDTYRKAVADNALDTWSDGLYWVAEEGEAVDGGQITIGWKDADGNKACDDDEGTVTASFKSDIASGSIKWAIKFGNKQLATEDLYGFIENDADRTAFYDTKITAYSDRIKKGEAIGSLTYIAGDKEYDYDIARAGRYDIIFTYVLKQDMKKQTLENEFAVTDTVASWVPVVNLLTTTTDGYNLNSFKDIIELSVDLNNNKGLSESLVEPGLIRNWVRAGKNDNGLKGYIADDFGDLRINRDDTYARYAVVEETIGAKHTTKILFFVPVGKNIKED